MCLWVLERTLTDTPGTKVVETGNSYNVLFGNSDLKQLEDSVSMMRMITATLFLVLSLAGCDGNSSSEQKGQRPSTDSSLAITSPAEVCALLDSDGLATRGWKVYGGNEYGCTSDYKDIGSGSPLVNHLAYYVDGDRNSVTQAALVLSVHNKSQAASGHSALLSSSEELGIKLATVKLPQPIKDAITEGKPITAKEGKTTIVVERDDWPTSKGYEIHVIFR